MGQNRRVLDIVPANRASWEDVEAVFGSAGPGRCFCQRYKLARGESFGGFPREERAFRLRQQTDADHPDSPDTSGLVALSDHGEPVGWVAIEPRPAYVGLVRVGKVPWEGRDEDKADDSVWAITCLLTRAGHRRQGLSRELAVAAVEHARSRGARAVEAYPITTTAVISEELHVGTVPTFEAAGLTIVSRPSKRRVVMRLDF